MKEFQQKVILQQDTEKEIREAEFEKRDADFSYKTIQELNLSNREIKCGLNFKNSVFLGSVYLGKTSINGDLILDGAVVNNTLYLGEVKVSGSISGTKVTIKNSLNIVRGQVENDLSFEKSNIQGFLSLNKSTIKGLLKLNGIKIISMETYSGTVCGDLFLQEAEIGKGIDLEWAYISGLADFQKMNLWGYLNLFNAKIGETLIMKESRIKGEIIFEGLEYNRIID